MAIECQICNMYLPQVIVDVTIAAPYLAGFSNVLGGYQTAKNVITVGTYNRVYGCNSSKF